MRLILVPVLLCAALMAAEIPSLPGGGTELMAAVNPVELVRTNRFDQSRADKPAQVTAVQVAKMPFTSAARVQISELPEKFWNVQASTKSVRAIVTGDVLHFRAYVRCGQAGGTAKLHVAIAETQPPHRQHALRRYEVGEEWMVIDIPLTAEVDFAPEALGIYLQLAEAVQTIEIGPIEARWYGRAIDVKKLPTTASNRSE